MQPLKERLVARRNRFGWSQETLAEKSKVSARSIAAYESGESQPTPRILAKLATALKCEAIWLMGGADSQVLQEAPRPMPTSEDCRRYFDMFLKTCEEDFSKIVWTQEELKAHFPLTKWKPISYSDKK